MPVSSTSRESYYKSCLTGKLTTQKDRIIGYLLLTGPQTRNQLDRYFNPRHQDNALDGGLLIPWASMTAAIAHTICKDDGCDHSTCGAYLRVAHYGDCPVSGRRAEFVAPIAGAWEQRRMF